MFNLPACLCSWLPGVPTRHRATLTSLLLLALAVGTLLCGCGGKDEEDLEPIPIDRLQLGANMARREDDIGSLPMTPMDNPVPGKNLFAGVVPSVSTNYNPGFRGADADYIDKADVYWMLNYIRRVILYGLPSDIPNTPENLREELVKVVTKARKQLEDANHDANYDLAVEAVRRLDKSIEHLTAQQKLEAAHISLRSIPWGTGVDSVQKYIDSGRLGFGAKKEESEVGSLSRSMDISDDEDDLMDAKPLGGRRASALSGLTRAQEEAIGLVLAYEKDYHTGPDKMVQREWSAAIEKINQLRDNLGLMDRDENKDGNSATPNPMLNDNPANFGVKNVVPIPEVGKDLPGSKSPPGAANAPDGSDPFALPVVPQKPMRGSGE